MNRKEFLYSGGLSCLGILALGLSFSSCQGVKRVNAQISGSDLLVPLSAFAQEGQQRRYIIAQNDQLNFPIYVYRQDDGSYSALLMQCTHQGAELQAFGDRLQCPAHGSEFTSMGEVQSGPAEQSLRVFPVIIESQQLRISLK